MIDISERCEKIARKYRIKGILKQHQVPEKNALLAETLEFIQDVKSEGSCFFCGVRVDKKCAPTCLGTRIQGVLDDKEEE